MGYYINPQDCSKEIFLQKYGRPISASEAEITTTSLTVCLVDNGPFTAAGIAYCMSELKAFSMPDRRTKKWYQVPREHLRQFME